MTLEEHTDCLDIACRIAKINLTKGDIKLILKLNSAIIKTDGALGLKEVCQIIAPPILRSDIMPSSDSCRL